MQTHAYHRRCARAVLVGITIALRRPHGRMKIVGCPGSLSGKTLRRCEVRPHLNPLPGGEEVASPPPLWIPAPYRGSGCVFAGKTKWGRRLAQVVVSRLAFFRGILVRGFPPPYRGTGHAFDRGNDEWGGRRNDDPGDSWDPEALSKPRRVIFVPIAHAGRGRHTKV